MAGGIWSTPNSPFPLQNPTDEQLRGQIHQNRETPGGRQGLGTRWGGGRCRATLRHLWPLPVPEFMEVWWLVPRMGRNPTLGTGHILVGGCPGTAPPPGVRATTDTGGGLSSTHFIKDAPRACPGSAVECGWRGSSPTMSTRTSGRPATPTPTWE